MKKKFAIILGLFFLTIVLLGLIDRRVKQEPSATFPAIQISSERIHPSNNKRSQIYLNGIWQFIPAEFANTPNAKQLQPPPPDAGWGSILVPGDWQRENHDFAPGVVKRGTGKAWEEFNGSKLAKAWYQRTIKIPQDWNGRSILLDIRRVSTDAIVYVNGIHCSEINWPYGAADITKVVKPGEEATLSILVAAAADEKEKTVIMSPNEMYKTEAKLASRGLIGEVRLLSLPQGSHVSDVFVRTSTRKQQIELEVELQGVRQTESVQFIAEMLDENGKVERRFTNTTNVKATPIQTLTLVWNWPNPQLWDVNQPNLYTLRLFVQGKGIEDEYDQRFGFREFWIEGRNFYLNGKQIRLRPIMFNDTWQSWAVGIPEAIDRLIDGYRWVGFNITEVWPWDHDERGRRHFQELFADRADLKGFPIMAPTLSVTGISSRKTWNPERQRWEERMATDLRRYRNHPSILMWASSPNFFGHSDDQNPRRIGKKKIEGKLNRVEDKRMAEIVPIGEEAVRIIKKYDPTRPVMMHQGATVGDVYALNSYLNLIPLQEREEWLSEWSQHGDMPYMVVEFGTPLHATMMRGRDGFSKAVVSEPLMTEFSAIYLGKQAYELETPDYRAKIRELFVKDQEYKNWFGKGELNYAPAFQKLQQLFSTNTWRSWRTFGMTGGMIPWNDGHGWEGLPEGDKKVDLGRISPEGRGVYLQQVPKSLWYSYQPETNIIHPGGQALLQNNGATLAWIAGSKAAFTAKDHNFTAGQKLQKQVVLINDTRSRQEFSFNWQVVNKQAIAQGQKTGTIESAQTLFFPIAVDLPEGTEYQKIDGEIRLLARIGNRQHEDRFAFRVFPKPSKEGAGLNINAGTNSLNRRTKPAPTGTIAVFDPVGKTTQLLKQLGYTVAPWDGSPTSSLLVIGREVLSGGHKLPGNLATFVRNGGRAIAFTQNPEWMQHLGFRIAPHLTRRIFPVDTTHPVVEGLDELDLRDWTGESTLVTAYPNTLDGNYKRNPDASTPWYGWHWSNRGAVSSVPVEKPHRSSWRPILESEFDLAYTPLMELDYGKGRLIWTTLDLEDHVPLDAAARQFAQQIINYGATAPLSPKADKVILIGNEADKAKLDALGLIYQPSNSLVADAGLTIVGEGVDIQDEELQAYLTGGGKIFFLPQHSPEAALGVRLHQVKDFGGSLVVPQWLEVRGISASDLRDRTEHDAWIIQSGGAIASSGLLTRITVGKGVAIFCQIDPDSLNADEKTYFRYTRWRQTRSLAQLLANLGASFKADEIVFKSPQTKRFFLNQSAPPPDLYHPDYRDDFELGDDPYRYYRW
jgi:beta-galactosidase